MNKIKFLTACLFILIVQDCFSQQQNRYWHLGSENLLTVDFGANLNTPQSFGTNVNNNHREGVASISDSNGNFLFYTDGQRVYDQNLAEIASGYGGNPSSSQSAIIVPSPCECDLFYVFTVSDWETERDNPGNTYMRYFTVNASIGNTLTAMTSIDLVNNCVEKLTAIPHSNGTDYWVVSPIIYTNRFATYRLHCDNGISELESYDNGTDPAGSQSVSGISNFPLENGYLKPSSNGRFLGAAFSLSSQKVELFNFDPNLGVISHNKTISTNRSGAYGIEFSPDNSKLYSTTWGWTNSNTEARLYEYDIISESERFFRVPLANINTNWYAGGAIQIGPDGLIYMALPPSNSLGSFDPNVADPFSTFNSNAISFTGINGNVRLGLPNLIPRFNICQDSTVQDAAVYCCPGDNLFTNGSFENGDYGFQSDYQIASSGNIPPGYYDVIDFNDASAICSNWNLQDHTNCINGSNNKVMVVNGRTTQTSNTQNVIWQQNDIPVELDMEYKFCANLKHLPQCCFDIIPTYSVQINQNDTWTDLIPWTSMTSNSTSMPCDWEEISGIIISTNSNISIRILLDEQGLGDGNDLALDDISLQEKPRIEKKYAAFGVSSPIDIGNNKFAVTANVALPLPDGCIYSWEVCEFDFLNNVCINSTLVSNPSQWLLVPYEANNDFAGYNGTNTLSGTSSGEFSWSKNYRIKRNISCGCESSQDFAIDIVSNPVTGVVSFKNSNTGEVLASQKAITTQLMIYPNPLNQAQKLNVIINTSKAYQAQIEILDKTGKKIIQEKINLKIGDNQINLDLNGLSSATYFLHIRYDKTRITTEKFVLSN